MEKLILYVVLIWLVYAILKIFIKDKKKPEDTIDAYYKKEFLLTIPERKFFEALQKLLPEKYICFPQMVVASVLSVKIKGKDYRKYRSKIDKKTIDFVIFEKEYLKPVLAIEYDDKSHNKSSRRKRDGFVNESLKQANLDIVHIKYGQNNLEEIINTEVIGKLK
jgi:hypothetical protein